MLDDFVGMGTLILGRHRNAVVSGRKRHATGPDDRIGQMPEVVAHVVVEVEINAIRERTARRVDGVCNAGGRRHDGIVCATLLFLVDLVETMGDLMRATTQESTRNILLLLVSGDSEPRTFGGGLAVLAK